MCESVPKVSEGWRTAAWRRGLAGLGLLVLLGWPVHAAAADPIGIQEALLRAKPAVALIVAEVKAEVRVDCGGGEVEAVRPVYSGTGTGWFISPEGFLITNAHVIQPAHAAGASRVAAFTRRATEAVCLPVLLKQAGSSPAARGSVEERIRRRIHDSLVPKAKVKLLPEVSVVLSNGKRLQATVKKYSPPVVHEPGQRPGRDLALLKVDGRDYPGLPVADSRTLKIGDPIHILGFPGVVLSHELLNQSSTVEASVTNGAISGFKEDVADHPVIQTDAPAAWGNSGGPAVNGRGEVVGVLTFVSLAPGPEGGIVQGFNFVVPSNAVRQFVQGTEVTPGAASGFNAAWWAGLRGFFTGDYVAAERRFQETNAFLANLPDVKRMLAETQEKIKNPPPRPFPWAWVALGVSLASAGGFGGLSARRWWRNRFRISPAQVVQIVERGERPVFLDVRSMQEFEAGPLKVPGAMRLAPEDCEAGRIELQADPQQMIVTYCSSPEEQTCARVTQQLRRNGYRNVRILKGGLGGWTNAGLPVEGKANLPAIGVQIYKSLAVGQLQRRRFAPGEVIFDEGDDARGEAFVVHSGRVDIRKSIDGKDRVLRTLGEGELIGELALIRDMPRSAGAVAATDAELLVVGRGQLEWLIRNRPDLTMEIVKRLSDWLASALGSLKPPAGAPGAHAAPPTGRP